MSGDGLQSSDVLPADSYISHQDATAYWNTQQASVSGMLGGLPQVSRTDIQGSKNFFAKLHRRSKTLDRRNRQDNRVVDSAQPDNNALESPNAQGDEFAVDRAVDCGAGIGRITLNFLSTIAHTTDIVEPISRFTDNVTTSSASENGRVGRIYNLGLQEWDPASQEYDLMWHQWCLGQLTDEELVSYFYRAKQGLRENGWIVVKENVASGEDEFDDADSSVTRALAKWRSLFRESGLVAPFEEVQRGFPKGLFEVRMWGLRPAP